MSSPEPKPWPQRPFFRHLVDVWIEKTGKTKKNFGELAGLADGSIKQYYSGKQIPGRELALKFAEILDCQISDLLGEPSGERPVNPEAEAFGNIMGILGKNLTPEMRAVMIEMAKAGQVKAAARRRAEKK